VELILVRHGLPVRTEAVQGAPATPPDPELSPIGRRQAGRLASGLAGERIEAVYSSPLRRARQTVEPLAARLGLPIVIDSEMHEIDIGEDSYIPSEELLPGDPRTQMWRAVLADQRSELVTAFRARIGTAIDAIATRHPGQTVLIGGHAGVITAALTNLLGVQQTFSFVVDYASVTRVRIRRDGRLGVLAVNDCAHLAR
jgi:probable phosphoglycerate mutase